METTKVTVETTISANTNKVWDYWTKPEHIIQWNFASEDWHCPKAENDLRVGGKYSARMEAKDGGFGFDFEAVYDQVINQKKIQWRNKEQVGKPSWITLRNVLRTIDRQLK